MAEKKDCFIKGKIYIGVAEPLPSGTYSYNHAIPKWEEKIKGLTSYPVIGTHSFKDGQDVTGLYKFKHQWYSAVQELWGNCTETEYNCVAQDIAKRIVATPLTPPDELDREAKELVNMFYQPLGYLKCGVSSNEMWEQAKKFAITHCNLMIEKLKKGVGEYFVNNQNHYTNLKQRIESL